MVKAFIGNVIVAAFLLLFVFINFKAFYTTGDISYILVSINESVYVVLFLVRERAIAVSTSGFDWAIAFSATFLGTLLRPALPLNILLGSILISIGIMVNIVSVLFLNRSISIVPARRSIKTGGLYRFVRHPMYSSEILSLFGYLLVNVSLMNTYIVIGTMVLMLARINREELFLSKNKLYREYLARTPWKLVPFVY